MYIIQKINEYGDRPLPMVSNIIIGEKLKYISNSKVTIFERGNNYTVYSIYYSDLSFILPNKQAEYKKISTDLSHIKFNHRGMERSETDYIGYVRLKSKLINKLKACLIKITLPFIVVEENNSNLFKSFAIITDDNLKEIKKLKSTYSCDFFDDYFIVTRLKRKEILNELGI